MVGAKGATREPTYHAYSGAPNSAFLCQTAQVGPSNVESRFSTAQPPEVDLLEGRQRSFEVYRRSGSGSPTLGQIYSKNFNYVQI